MKHRLAMMFIVICSLLIVWFLTTNDTRIWPIRNTFQYSALKLWWEYSGFPEEAGRGTLRGSVTDADGTPIAGARLLVARWDGTTWSTRSGTDGTFVVEEIDAGAYRPVAGAPGYENVQLGGWWGGVRIENGQQSVEQIVLPRATPRAVSPGEELTIGEASQLSCQKPLERRATRRELSFMSDGEASQQTFLYTPISATVESLISNPLPTLFAVYPGPVDSWECVSLPLADAGYAVLAIGPAYSLDLERDVDQMEQLLGFARQGQLPGVDGTQIVPLAGSYSTLLVQRLLQRDHDFKGAVLLGAPTDLFDIRRVFEEGTFRPPFGLDKALVALGFPDRVPLRYWTYSGAYHTHPDMPPTILFHSRSDEIVPYQQSQLLADAFTKDGVPHELYFFDGGNHYLLSADQDALEIYRLTLDFLAQHLE